MLGSIFAGLLGDRLGRKPVLIGCVAMFGAFSLISVFADSPLQLAGLRFLTGLGLGGGLPTTVALASDFAPRQNQQSPLILMIVGVPIGFTVGGFLASLLVRLYGWPAIFVAGGIMPFAIVPLLAILLPPEFVLSGVKQHVTNLATLFQNGLALSTSLLWAINALNLLGIYFILQWTPSLLHNNGVTPSLAILGTTLYGVGTIASPILIASMVDRCAIERVLTCGLSFGACCVLVIGLFYPRFWVIALLLCGVGIGGGCQAGIMSLSALTYPPAIRSTGAGWTLGAGRVGTIAGPLLAGLLLGLGVRAQKLFLLAAVPALGTSLLMALLYRLRRNP
jgi:AAHS family 4-hydroxybenzoate transporter-like MFS transporter